MNVEKLQTPTPPVGVIESLAAGFDTVAGRLVLILIPLLLDLFLWIGPRLSIRPAIATYYEDIWQPTITSFDAEMQESFGEVTEVLLEAAQEMPLLYLPVLGIPSLMANDEAAPLPLDYTPPVWELERPLGMIGVYVALLLAGGLLSVVYVALIAGQVRDGTLLMQRILHRLPINLMWLALLAILIPLIFIIVYVPFVLLAFGLSLINGALGMIADWAGRLLVLWIALFLFFTIHGLFMNEKGLLLSLWDSIRVVQWNMSATLFLVLLVFIINLALNYIWSMAPSGSWLAPIGIAGHAFISTGLIAGTFVFFKDRYRYWREMRAELLAELERRRAQQN